MGIRELMAKRAAEEIEFGNIVNVGYGIGQKVINYVPKDKLVFFHSESGVLGMGPAAEKGHEDPDIIDSGIVPITLMPGASFSDSPDAFGLIRSGKIDVTVLGTLEVSEKGDLANWSIPGVFVPGMGGAMELAQNVKKVVVVTTHVTKKGEPKLRRECRFPLTVKECVSVVITDFCVIYIENGRFVLKELFEGHTVEEVISTTDAEIIVDKNIKIIKSEQ